jgi:CheY-like chemotaxis protein
MFQDSFELQFAETAGQTLELIQKTRFQFVILDIHLPDKTGLDVCRAVNGLPEEQQPHIVILSADSDDAVVKEAYELGVGDYIVKPFNVTAFYERLLRFSRDLDKIEALEQQDATIHSMTETVMKQAASYGNGLELISRLNSCHDAEALCHTVLQNFLGQGFHCAIQVRTPDETLSFDVDVSECSDIELQIFELLRAKGRIYNFGKRCIFNDEHVSILIKNMPLEGTQSYDSMLDVAAKLIPAINARFISICEHNSLVAAKESLSKALGMLSEGVNEMEMEKRQLMESIEMQIGMSFHHLDMDEDQEAFFLNMIEREIRSREESSKLDKIQSVIANCVDSINIMEHDDEEDDSDADKDNSGHTEDVQLF